MRRAAVAALLALSGCADVRVPPSERRTSAMEQRATFAVSPSRQTGASVTPPPATAAPVAPLGPVETEEVTCGDSTEAGAMRCSEGSVTRRGDTLTILLGDGRAVSRVDRPVQGEDELLYTYAGRFGGVGGTSAYHILGVHANDSNGVLLINALSGDSLDIAGVPVPSADGARFASAAMSLDVCEGSTSLDVWRITGDQPVNEFHLEPGNCMRGWGPSDLKWQSADTLTFLRNTVSPDSSRRRLGLHVTTPARLIRSAGRWSLDLGRR